MLSPRIVEISLKRGEDKQQREDYRTLVTRGELFSMFLRAGFAFGGGLGILAVLEDELVSKRRVVSRDEFLTIYGIGRVVPSGTMTALAVAYGYKFCGMSGTVIALTALSLPVFVLTIALTISPITILKTLASSICYPSRSCPRRLR